MSRLKSKEYHRPYMIVESFVPNEYVAACVKNYLSWASGIFCIDKDGDGKFIGGKEEEDNTGTTYTGGSPVVNKILDGKFRIVKSGRYVNDELKAYFYVGEGSFNWNGPYDYSSNSFVPMYYANIDVEDQAEPFNVYFKEEDYGSGVTNAS